MSQTSVEAPVSEEPSIRETEEPPLREIPLQPACGDCALQCSCPIGTKRTGQRERLLPILNAAATTGGKKDVRRKLSLHDSGVIESILAADAYGIPNVTSAACVNGKNEKVIKHAAKGVLHDRRSSDEHRDRRTSQALSHAKHVAVARTPVPEELLSLTASFPIPQNKGVVDVVRNSVTAFGFRLKSFAQWVASSASWGGNTVENAEDAVAAQSTSSSPVGSAKELPIAEHVRDANVDAPEVFVPRSNEEIDRELYGTHMSTVEAEDFLERLRSLFGSEQA